MQPLNIPNNIDKFNEENDKSTKYFTDILNENMNTYKYIYMLKNIEEEYKYKNIINFINHKWIRSQNILFKKYNETKHKREVIKVDYDIDFIEFNEILTKFIDNNIVVAIFVVNSITNYLF